VCPEDILSAAATAKRISSVRRLLQRGYPQCGGYCKTSAIGFLFKPISVLKGVHITINGNPINLGPTRDIFNSRLSFKKKKLVSNEPGTTYCAHLSMYQNVRYDGSTS